MNFKLKSIRNIAVAMWRAYRQPFVPNCEHFSDDLLGIKKHYFGLAKIAYEEMRKEVMNEFNNRNRNSNLSGEGSAGSGGNPPSSGSVPSSGCASSGSEFTENPPTTEEVQSVKLLLSARGDSSVGGVEEEIPLRDGVSLSDGRSEANKRWAACYGKTL